MSKLFHILSHSIGKPEEHELLQSLSDSFGPAEIIESNKQWRLLDFPDAGISLFCFDGVVISVLLHFGECPEQISIRRLVNTKIQRKQCNAPIPGGITYGDTRSVVQQKMGRQPISGGLSSDINKEFVDYYDFDQCDLKFTFDGVTRQLDCLQLLVKRDWSQYVDIVDCPEVNEQNFSEDALASIRHAHGEAQKLGHNFIGSEHLLLGMLSGQSIAAKVLESHNVTLDAAQQEVTRITSQRTTPQKFAPQLTPRTRLLLSLAMKLASSIGGKKIASEHVLLAIVEHQDGVASTVLENLGIDLTNMKRTIVSFAATDSQ